MLDYPEWRPTSPSMAPFFFAVYLPSIGMHIPGVVLPSPSWPDFDSYWPELPPLTLPRARLPDLIILLRVRLPHIAWPTLPDVVWPGLPCMDLDRLCADLRLKFPSVGWPALPAGVSLTFPDASLPGIDINVLLPELRLRFPDVGWPELPAIDWPNLPALSVSDFVGMLRLRLPDLEWPALQPPEISLPDLQLVLRLRMPVRAHTPPHRPVPPFHTHPCPHKMMRAALTLHMISYHWCRI
jgi:hypothetical protein